MRAIVVFALVSLPCPAQALSYDIPPLLERVALADAVVFGRIVAIEERPVLAAGRIDEQVNFQVLVVKIEHPLVGAAGLSHVRVGTIPDSHYFHIRQDGEFLLYPPTRPALGLGVEALFFLVQHPTELFYTAYGQFDVNCATPAHRSSLATTCVMIEELGQLRADPDKSLRSSDANKRFLTAAMLLTRYRAVLKYDGRSSIHSNPARLLPYFKRPPRRESLPAEESRLILRALRDADWQEHSQLAHRAFERLSLGEPDGWREPAYSEVPSAARAWLKRHADTYRIERFILDD